jgi:ATP phosphoribosyltransferase regulatory subunit HisZ
MSLNEKQIADLKLSIGHAAKLQKLIKSLNVDNRSAEFNIAIETNKHNSNVHEVQVKETSSISDNVENTQKNVSSNSKVRKQKITSSYIKLINL